VGTQERPDEGHRQQVVTDELVARLVDGDKRALTRILSFVENGHPEGRRAMKALFARTGHAHIVGMTGPSGSGKSTLAGALAREYRSRGRTVGIVAVDPTSPFSRGALLGDRIRMQELTSDPGVFIRSMATRGALGGLAPATNDVVTILDAAHKDVIIVETVGAGQDEVEVADTAHTTAVISVPGAGDEVQALKAGILEIADILVVNKADQPRADITARQLAAFLNLSRDEGWQVPVLQTVALKGEGVVELADAIDRHRAFLETSGRLEEARRHRARRHLLALAQEELLARVLASAEADGRVERLVEAIARRQVDPHTAAERLIEGVD
jgi:LAO/AO transport system kinase